MNALCTKTWVTLLAALAGALASCGGNSDADGGSRLEVAKALRRAPGDEGYDRADRPREFVFPGDHGPHPDFRTEWWYATGNLFADDGRRFGFHLTIFRTALRPEVEDTESSFRTRQIYMGHFAIADAESEETIESERFARGAGGLAGAQGEPFRVWLEDWSFEEQSDGRWRLRAAKIGRDEFAGLDLMLAPKRRIVLQGDRGLSIKSTSGEQASYYYSIPRLEAEGTVRIDDENVGVRGSAWFDREWSTSALDRDQVGWDWFALQLDDDRELMVYRLRRDDGTTDPASEGVLVTADSTRRLSTSDFALEPVRRWQSPRSGSQYPIGWRVRVPSEGLDLRVDAVFEDQELDLTFRYWEGAVDVRGSSTGVGYLEMTGYADR